jgi:hypothetical protein
MTPYEMALFGHKWSLRDIDGKRPITDGKAETGIV